MNSQTNKTCRVIYDTSEETRIKEMARMREKALHDEASALKNAKEEGAERVEKSMMSVLKDYGLTEEQINEAILKSRLQRGG